MDYTKDRQRKDRHIQPVWKSCWLLPGGLGPSLLLMLLASETDGTFCILCTAAVDLWAERQEQA